MSETPQDWMDEITEAELPESHRKYVRIMGLPAAIQFSREFGGGYVYVPKMDRILNLLRDRHVRKEFTGCNHRALGLKYNLSETWIRHIVESADEDRQASLFVEPDPAPPLPP